MYVEHLTIDKFAKYLASLDQSEYPGDPYDKEDCPLIRYLYSLGLFEADTIEMDMHQVFTIRSEDETIENLPDWCYDFVVDLADLQRDVDNLMVSDAYLTLRRVEENIIKLKEMQKNKERKMLFHELSEDVQQKLHEEYLRSNDNYDWHESSIDYWQDEIANEASGDKVEISFSGFSSQGDGASFTGKFHVETMIKDVLGETSEYPLLVYILENNDMYDEYVEIYRTNNHYYHNNSVTVGEIAIGRHISDLESYVEDEIESLRDSIKSWHDDKAYEIYKALEAEYDELQSFEYFAEYQRDMGFEFDEDGNEILN